MSDIINIDSKELSNCLRVWVVIIDENGKPRLKHGDLMNEGKKFFNVRVDGYKIKVKEIFQGVKEALEKCEEINDKN